MCSLGGFFAWLNFWPCLFLAPYRWQKGLVGPFMDLLVAREVPEELEAVLRCLENIRLELTWRDPLECALGADLCS